MSFTQLSSKVLTVAVVVIAAPVAATFVIAILGGDPVPADRLAMLLQALPPHFTQKD